MARLPIELDVNGAVARVEVDPAASLLRTLREDLRLTGAKPTCQQGACGGCTVLVDGRLVRSCLIPAGRLHGSSVQTVEGLAADGELTDLQVSFIRHGGMQCGYCTGGMLVRLTALLRAEPTPSSDRVREALGSNLCRCTGYEKIVESVLAVADLRAASPGESNRWVGATTGDAQVGTDAADGGVGTEAGDAAMGARLPQQRAAQLVTGRQRYATDMTLPGMVHAKVLRSPHAHARIRSIDASRAVEIPGVLCVLTPDDVPGLVYNSAFRNPNDRLTLRPDERVLNDRARYDGDRVAAVAAETLEVATAALSAIEVDWEPLPAYDDPLTALEPGAVEIHEGTGNLGAEPKSVTYGDPERAWEAAEIRLEATYRTAAVQHANLEPKAVIADVAPDGRLTLYATTQVPFHVRRVFPMALGIPESQVRIVATDMGGGQGERSDPADEYVAALLAMRLRRPVKLVNTREEQFTSTRVRHAAVVHSGLAAARDGTLLARRTRATIATGGYATMGYRVMLSLGVRSAALYRVPAVAYEGRVAYTNTPVGGGMRGFGSPQAAFAIESQLDELAGMLEIDPIDLRLRNVVRTGDRYLDLDPEWEVRSAAVEGLKAVRARTDWNRKRRELGGTDPSGRLRGIGIALGSHISTVMPYYRDHGDAQIVLGEDGTFVVLVGVPETGTGSTTVYAQLAAEALGIPSDRVRVEVGDTDRVPYDQGAHSSRTTYVAGSAVRAAAENVRDEILAEAAKMLEASPKDLELEAGRIAVKGSPGSGASIEEVARWVRYESDHPRQIGAEGSFVPQSVAPPYAACVAEVAVDPHTGRVLPERVTLAMDCGRPVNPMFVEGQLHGAIHMGVGAAISEEMSFDASGRLRSRSFADYQLLRAAEMPAIDTIILDSEEPTGPFGAKGLGEASVVPIAPAIANAVAHAAGVRPRELPLTPERVLALVEAEGAR